MASAFQNAWQLVLHILFNAREWHISDSHHYRTALEAEGKLLKSLAEKEPTFTEIFHYLFE
jgi:hypothetical protein